MVLVLPLMKAESYFGSRLPIELGDSKSCPEEDMLFCLRLVSQAGEAPSKRMYGVYRAEATLLVA